MTLGDALKRPQLPGAVALPVIAEEEILCVSSERRPGI
jgi:hypothetical protein